MNAERRRTLLAPAILAAVPTLLFFDLLFAGQSLFLRDLSHLHYPAKKLLRDIVLSGHFPWWNPFFGAGQPLAANAEHEVFYPLTWLILLPSYRLAFHLLILAHVYLATFSMYALLRSMELRRTSAVIGALSFGIGGLAMSATNLLPYLFNLAWLPLTCLFTRRFLLGARRRDLALAALSLGMQLLIGEPTSVLQTGILLGAYALYRRSGVRGLAVVALICVAGLLVAAVQVLPLVDHYRDTLRANGLPWEIVSRWSTPPARIAEAFLPDADPLLASPTPFFFSIYSGLAIAVLCAAGVLARLRGWGLFLALAATSFVLAAGSHLPLLRWLYDAGIGRSTRYPEKFVILGVFAAIVFGAYAFDRLAAGEARLRRFALGVAVVVLAFAIAGGSLANSLRAGVLLALLAAFTRIPRPLWLGAAAAFATVDVAAVAMQLTPREPAAFYDEPAAAQLPRERASFRVFHFADWTALGDAARTYYRPRPERYWILRNAMPPLMPATHGLRMALENDYGVTALGASEDFRGAALELSDRDHPDWLNVVAAMANVRFIGVYRPAAQAFAEAGGDLRRVEPVKFVEGRAWPRYYFATQLVTIRDRDDFVAKLLARRYDRHAAFVRQPAFPPARGAVRGVREWPNGARLDVEAEGLAFLVMSVTPHRYWQVTIDGQDAPSFTANLGFQGVLVPPGRHVVEMRYRNPLILTGAAVSIASLLGLLLITMRAL